MHKSLPTLPSLLALASFATHTFFFILFTRLSHRGQDKLVSDGELEWNLVSKEIQHGKQAGGIPLSLSLSTNALY